MAAVIDPGTMAPDFSLKDQHGTVHRLAEYRGRPVVLFFYPKDSTPGCTIEACAFETALPDFAGHDAVVLGVSVLDEASKARFARKHGLTFPLLADVDHAVAEAYGAWREKRMFGWTYMGVTRMTYLISADGRVLRRWDRVKVSSHAAEVAAALAG